MRMPVMQTRENDMIRPSKKYLLHTAAFAAAALAADAAWAHDTAVHASASLAAGFAHPFSGIDHLLAFAAIGLWAAQHAGRAMSLLPAVFLAAMGAGAAVGATGAGIPGLEAGIAVSLGMLGLLIAFAARLPLAAGAALVSLFALMHGYAHGLELPPDTSAALYGAGFLAATALLHMVGLLAGLVAKQMLLLRTVRTAGVMIAATGVCRAAGVFPAI
jgi:urease accessory protein